MKKISIMVLIVFILSNAAYGAGEGLYKTSLRVPLVCGKGEIKGQAQLDKILLPYKF